MPDLVPVTSLSTVDTVYSADSVEWCPGQPTLFAVGTYQIEKDPVPEAVDEAAESLAKTCLADDGEGQSWSDDEDSGEDEDGAEGSGGGKAAGGPGYKRYGRCLLYQVDTDGKNV